MTKDVLVTIEGLQIDVDAEAIKVCESGQYHLRNGKHYIQYDEKVEGGKGVIKNIIKISQNQISIIKKGFNETTMVFNVNEVTRTDYSTPYGMLPLDIRTKIIRLDELENEILVFLTYSLSMSDNHLTDNSIKIKITSQL